MKNVAAQSLAILAGWMLSVSLLCAQNLQQVIRQGLSTIEKQQWIIAGQVKTLKGDPASQARVHIHYDAEGIAENDLQADLQGKYSVTLELAAQTYSTLTVTVSADKEGFFEALERATFTQKGQTYPINLVMLPVKPDGPALPMAELLTAFRPRYQAAHPPELKTDSERQDFSRGVELFFGQHEYSSAYPLLSVLAKKHPRCVECKTVLGLAELQAGGLVSARQEFAEAGLVKLSPPEGVRKVNALIVLSVLDGWSGEFAKAAGLLMDALKLAPHDPLVLQELGRTLINQKNWEAADEYLQKAVKDGASPEAHLLRCRAVLEDGDAQEAEVEMRAYLGGRDIRTQPLDTRILYTEVRTQLSLLAYQRSNTVVTQPLSQLLAEQPDLAGLAPAADQRPLKSILQKTGASVEAFFKGFQNATSAERIEEEQIGKNGKVKRSLEQRFHYLLLASPFQDGLSLDEYRTNPEGAISGPGGLSDGFMLTAGFASASLVFHPAYQAGANFRLLGRAKVDGAVCDVVAFAQNPQKARTFGRFSSHSATALVLHQGIAWVNPDDSRIVRLRTDLLEPLPRVRLQRETTEIHYSLIRFKDVPAPVSLPAEVTVTVQWKNRTYRNLHQYSEFRLFNTAAHEKRRAQTPPPPAGPTPD